MNLTELGKGLKSSGVGAFKWCRGAMEFAKISCVVEVAKLTGAWLDSVFMFRMESIGVCVDIKFGFGTSIDTKGKR